MPPLPNEETDRKYNDVRTRSDVVNNPDMTNEGGNNTEEGTSKTLGTLGNMEDEKTKDDQDDTHKVFLTKLSQRWVTVEPVVIVYMVGYISLFPMLQQYIYRRLAADYNITASANVNKSSTEICLERMEDSQELTENEKVFQETVSLWNTMMVVFGVLPTAIVVVFIGALSDTRGRKLGFVPQVGAAVVAGVLIIVVVSLDLNLATIPLIQFMTGITGSMAAVMSSAFAYIADIHPPEQRFIRILVLEIGIGFGTLIGQIFFGWLIDVSGFVIPAIIFTVLESLVLAYTLFLLPETVQRNPDTKSSCTCAALSVLPQLWFQDKNHLRRVTIWVSLTLTFTTSIIQDVPGMIITFFFLDPPLCWTSFLIGCYNGVSFILRALGSILLMRLLFKRVPNAALQAISLVSGALLFLCLGFSTKTWIPFLGALLGCGSMLVTPVTRAMASRVVSDSQQGALFAGLLLGQMLALLVGSPVINIIYAKTTPETRGLIFLFLMATLVVPLILVGIGWHFEHWYTENSKDLFPTKVRSCEFLRADHQSKTDMDDAGHQSKTGMILSSPNGKIALPIEPVNNYI